MKIINYRNVINNVKLKLKLKLKIRTILFKNLCQTKRLPQTIEQLLNEISPQVDELMVGHAKKHSCKALGGELKTTTHDNGSIFIQWDLYFVDTHQKYQKIHGNKSIARSSIIQKDYEMIKNNSPVFTINPPEAS